MPQPRPTYVRFIVGQRDPHAHVQQGIFQPAGKLRGSGRLEPWEYDAISDALQWLGTHLDAPPILQEPGTERAISWFKPVAQDAISHVREICRILSEYGHTVRQITTRDPGPIIYEDDLQIVAYPPRGRL